MNHEFKGLVPILNAYHRDIMAVVREKLFPFKKIFPGMSIVIGIIFECPNDCDGRIAITSGMRTTAKVVCPKCKRRIDVSSWRTNFLV